MGVRGQGGGGGGGGHLGHGGRLGDGDVPVLLHPAAAATAAGLLLGLRTDRFRTGSVSEEAKHDRTEDSTRRRGRRQAGEATAGLVPPPQPTEKGHQEGWHRRGEPSGGGVIGRG